LQRKDRVLRVRLSEDEYELSKAFAESHETTLSAVFRFLIRAIRQLDEQRKRVPEKPATATEA